MLQRKHWLGPLTNSLCLSALSKHRELQVEWLEPGRGSSTGLLLLNTRNISHITFYIYIFRGEPPNPVTSDFMTWLLSDSYTRELCPFGSFLFLMISEFLLVLRIALSYKTILHVALPKTNAEKNSAKKKKKGCFELLSKVGQDTERTDNLEPYNEGF